MDGPEQAVALDEATYRGLGERLRARRQEVGISLRELARRIGVSASLISQIETGKVQPSVSTLYALVDELGGSVDELLFGDGATARGQVRRADAEGGDGAGSRGMLDHPAIPPVQRAAERKRIQLDTGVTWELLTSEPVPGVEFLHVTYPPGAESAPEDAYQRHSGREWGYVIAGTLHVAVGFEEHVLHPGDAITYASTVPHRLSNRGDEPVEAIWFQLA
jgi:transcriptional regulator with XRE-family HTH domain